LVQIARLSHLLPLCYNTIKFMPNATTEEHHHAEEFIKLFYRGLLPLVLFVGGIFVLGMRLKGWSLLLFSFLFILGLRLAQKDGYLDGFTAGNNHARKPKKKK